MREALLPLFIHTRRQMQVIRMSPYGKHSFLAGVWAEFTGAPGNLIWAQGLTLAST